MPAFQFNSQGIEPQYGAGGSQLPLGKHPVVITKSSLEPTRDAQGGFMALTLQAIDGPAKGVEHIDRLNLHNKNPDTVRIANQQLSAYCAVTGVLAFNVTEELHNKPFVVDIVQDAKNPQYTRIAALYDMNGNPPEKAGAGAPQGGGQPQGGGAWGGQGGGQPQTGAGPAPADTGGGQPAWGGGQPQTGGQPAGGQPAGGATWNQGQGGGQPGWGAR
jgi:hypothetical protein